jgi:hypothetical protein
VGGGGSKLVLPKPTKRYAPSFKPCLAQDQTNFLSLPTTVLSFLYCNIVFFTLLKRLQAAKRDVWTHNLLNGEQFVDINLMYSVALRTCPFRQLGAFAVNLINISYEVTNDGTDP